MHNPRIQSRPVMRTTRNTRSTTQKRTRSQPATRENFDSRYEYNVNGWGERPTESIFTLQNLATTAWPLEMGPVLVVSIRSARMGNFVQRMGPWMKHMRRFPATDGRLIQPAKWISTRKVLHSMNAGRMGCYDSHVRIWETIANGPHDVVTVLEDDVDFCYNNATQFLSQLQLYFKELKDNEIQWDGLCWGHGPWAFDKNRPINGLAHWRTPGTCQGFFAYTISRKLAQLLVTKCYPYKNVAVDKWFFDDFVPQTGAKILCAEPRLCWVVDVKSDTNVR